MASFGFRGEALSSLSALSDLSIVTRDSKSGHGFKLQFDKHGILEKKEKIARERGTTVIVKNIFKDLPVRFKEFQKNIKKEFARAVQVLYGYCLVSSGVKITCTNSYGNNKTNLVVSTSNNNSILDNVSSIFGKKARDSLIEISLEPPNEIVLEEYGLNVEQDALMENVSWRCFASKSDLSFGRSSPDRQFFYINGRPCDIVKVGKIINQIYHKFNTKQYPFIFLDLKLDKESTDVNVTPDKRTIFLTREKIILAIVKSNFTKAWETAQVIQIKSYARCVQ